jgi:hypothetical protein
VSPTQWIDFTKEYNLSKNTIRRVASSYGYHKGIMHRKPFISLAAKKKRRLWALVIRWTHWKRAIFRR